MDKIDGFDKKLKVIFRGDKQDFERGSTDAEAIDYLKMLKEKYPDKVFVKAVSNVHMKAYLIDGESLLVTSGNMTPRGLSECGTSGNVEGGIACDDKDVIKKFLSYYESVFNAGIDVEKFVDLICLYTTDSEIYTIVKPLSRQRCMAGLIMVYISEIILWQIKNGFLY